MKRALTSVMCLGALLACSAEPEAQGTRSAGRPDAGRSSRDAAARDPEPRDGGASSIPGAAASFDAGGEPEPWPPAPTADGVHLSIERAAYETASEAYFYETERVGIQGQLPDDASLRVELLPALGVQRCSEGAVIIYEVPEGRLRADDRLGSCTIEVSALGEERGDRIAATFVATLERATGEGADALEVQGRLSVGHP